MAQKPKADAEQSDTPQAVMDRMNAAVKRALATPPKPRRPVEKPNGDR
jgi:hypothetical protein